MDASEPLVAVRGACVTLGDTRALEHVDLEIHPGEIVTLLGPNGAGKTTLARAVLGSQPLDAGEVWRKPGLRMGYMPQRIHLDRTLPLTVDRFLWLGAPEKPAQRLQALERTGIAQLAPRPVQKLSGGEMQRVLLARALLRKPDLLVLDEPAQGVDVAGQSQLYQLLSGIRDELGCAILMISHDLHLVMAATDQVICMQHHVCCSGTPEAVRRNPAFHDLFPGHSELVRQLAVYTHEHDHAHDLHGDGAEHHEHH